MGLRKNEPLKEEVVKEEKDDIVAQGDEKLEADKEEVIEEQEIVKTDDDVNLENDINEKRKEYKVYADKQRKINIAITTAISVVLLGAFICMMVFGKTYDWVLYVCLGVMILVLAGTYLSSNMMKKKLMAQSEVYIDYLYEKTGHYVYDDEEVKNLVITPKGSLDDKWFHDAHFYKDIVNTKGRNFAHFEYKGVEVDTCDLAANMKIKGKLSPKFLGRYYSFKANNKTDGKVTVFQLKGGKLSIPLDDIDDLKLIEGNDKYCIYSNDPNAKKVLNSKVIKELQKFKVVDPLIDVIFSVKDNLISLGIDYADEYLNIPVDSDFTIKNTKIAKQDFKKVVNVLETLLQTAKNNQEENNK